MVKMIQLPNKSCVPDTAFSVPMYFGSKNSDITTYNYPIHRLLHRTVFEGYCNICLSNFTPNELGKISESPFGRIIGAAA